MSQVDDWPVPFHVKRPRTITRSLKLCYRTQPAMGDVGFPLTQFTEPLQIPNLLAALAICETEIGELAFLRLTCICYLPD